MLPGIRILFATILLSVSVLIFGLGAAAYLRSAHEHFASATIRPIEDPAVTRLEQAPATIAMLRVEPEAASAPSTIKAEPPGPVTTPAEAPPATPTATASAVTAAAPQPKDPDPLPSAVRTSPESAAAAAPPAQADAPKPAQPVVAIANAVSQDTTAEVQPPPVTAQTMLPDPAPTVVAALGTDKIETSARVTSENAPAAVAATAVETTPVTTDPPAGSDTLKADDKAIGAPKVAAIADPASPDVAPIPQNEVKIPAPRVDPAEIEAQHKRQLAQKQARARAAKARRLAAARARAAAQAKAAASNPFGSPSAGASTNTATKSGS